MWTLYVVVFFVTLFSGLVWAGYWTYTKQPFGDELEDLVMSAMLNALLAITVAAAWPITLPVAIGYVAAQKIRFR